jgi:NAD(P)-dependent dehydrogenase (short-subunit alcohol dehydrogenase family)
MSKFRQAAGALLIAALSLSLYKHLSVPSSSDLKTELANKRVLLCGIGYEVGEQLAYQLAQQGAKLVIFYRADGRQKTLLNLQKTFELTDDVIQIIQPLMVARTDTKAMEIKETALKMGSPQVEIFPFNFGNASSAHLVVDTAVSLLGGLDYVVLNYADIPRGLFLHSLKLQNIDFLRRTFSVNVYSYMEIALKALPHLEKTSGHMFVTSSLLGEIPQSGLSVFSSTKHALNGFFFSLQEELLKRGSGVSLTVGTVGVLKSNELRALLEVPESLMGDIAECALRIMNSLLSRPKTFTYPAVHPTIARFVWSFFSN